MSEPIPETGQPPQGGNEPEYKPPATQQDLNRILDERVKRERAKYADYNDLKGKAAEYDKLAEANKTETQKAADRVTAAEAEVAKVPAKVAEALKAHLVSLHEISDEDAELFLTANEPGLLLKQIARLAGRESERKKQGNHVPREGTNPAAPKDQAREAVRGLFSG